MKIKKVISLMIIVVFSTVLFSGCWDDHDVNELFIVTGMALDKSKDEEMIDIAVQITKPSSGSGGGENKKEVVILKTSAKSILEGINHLNRNSNRTLLLQHNQVLLFGQELAQQGLEDKLDLFLRSSDSRMEVLVMVAHGRADEVLSSKLDQEDITGMYLENVMQNLYRMSVFNKVRMIDFVSRLREASSSPVAPIVKLIEQEDQKEIEVDGLAVFTDGKMVGQLKPEGMMGYIWAMGKVSRCEVFTNSPEGDAMFYINDMDIKRKVEVTGPKGVRVKLTVNASMKLGEIKGFKDWEPLDIMPVLVENAEKQVKKEILDTFQSAQKMNTDIYEFGIAVHRTNPKAWKSMKLEWSSIFPEIELDVDVNVKLPATGQIVKSLEMEDNKE